MIRAAALAFALGASCAFLGVASAQGDGSAQEQAEALNAQGKALIKQLDLNGAAQRFRAAMALSPDPRYAFNLCYTLEKSGQLEEARDACEQVMNSGDPRLSHKANKLLAAIEEGLASRGGGDAPVPPDSTPPPTTSTPRQPPGPPPAPPVPSTTPRPAERARFGVAAGLSRANVSTNGDTDPIYGFAVGAWMRLPVRRTFESLFEVQLAQRGFQVGGALDLARAELASIYADLGFASRWHMGTSGFEPYLEAGMMVSLLLDAKARVGGMAVAPEQQALDVAYTVGLGTRVEIGSRAFDVRARYNHGLLNINNSDAGPAGDAGQAYNRSAQLQVGIWF